MQVMALETLPGIKKDEIYDVAEILDNCIFRIQQMSSEVGWYNKTHFTEVVENGRSLDHTAKTESQQKTNCSQDGDDPDDCNCDL